MYIRLYTIKYHFKTVLFILKTQETKCNGRGKPRGQGGRRATCKGKGQDGRGRAAE